MHVSTADITRQIQAERGLSKSQAYKIARRERLQNEPPLQPGFSRKEGVLEALYRINSRPGVRPETLMTQLKAMQVKINLTELLSATWDLQKQQYVTFKETHLKGGSALEGIRLTTYGKAHVQVLHAATEPQGAEYAGPKMKAGSSRRSRQVGKDMTSWANHGTKARGGPVERINGAPVEQEILPALEVESPKLGDPLPQNMKAPISSSLTGETEHASAVTSEVMGSTSEVSSADGDTHTQYPQTPEDLHIDAEAFPYLASLIDRRFMKALAREKAARIVEAASSIADVDPDGAEILMTRAADLEGPSMTHEELEMLRYIDQCGGN